MKRAIIVLVLFAASIGILIFYKQNKSTVENKVKKSVNEKLVPVVVGAGDIACNFVSDNKNECRQKETAEIVEKINPDIVLALGDLQYPDGSINNINNYYNKTWGKFKDITFPTVGNHEYTDNDANGYFEYFGLRAGEKGKGYYSFDLGDWHIISLNSNCWVTGCSKGSMQEKWLRQDLEKNNSKCTLVFWHHPLFTNAGHEGDKNVKDLWEVLMDYKTEIVLNGHDHVYERFARQDANGIKTENGIREFVVGTGGRNLYDFKTNSSNLEAKNSGSFGVLKLVLEKDFYSWEFVPTEPDGFRDRGKDFCI